MDSHLDVCVCWEGGGKQEHCSSPHCSARHCSSRHMLQLRTIYSPLEPRPLARSLRPHSGAAGRATRQRMTLHSLLARGETQNRVRGSREAAESREEASKGAGKGARKGREEKVRREEDSSCESTTLHRSTDC
mmetsp:Transcript_10889/g.36740  ORF Transcript_10889/g.36740 Transcript_10889/m.36740 type:complete len:133 (-) Transcript_10889:461-859(-)